MDAKMNPILKSMVDFIRTHGHERVQAIEKMAEDEYTVQKENYIAEEKEKIINDYSERLRKDEINLKIERSKKENAMRIERMRTTNTLIQQLFAEARVTISKKITQDKRMYAELIKNLIIQVSLILFFISIKGFD